MSAVHDQCGTFGRVCIVPLHPGCVMPSPPPLIRGPEAPPLTQDSYDQTICPLGIFPREAPL